MSDELRNLAARIRDELDELEIVFRRVQEGWRRSQQASDDLYLDSVALNLHGWYSGLERLFELIAAVIDHAVPMGERWHEALLRQMTDEVLGVRPAVISQAICEQLDEYRRFRHVVRNVYAFHFEQEKMARLVEHAQPLFSQIRAELLAFADFLAQTA